MVLGVPSGDRGTVACENIRFSSFFAARETSPAAKSEEKRMFSQASGTGDIDCLQSAFSLKIRLVLISSSAIANHDVVVAVVTLGI